MVFLLAELLLLGQNLALNWLYVLFLLYLKFYLAPNSNITPVFSVNLELSSWCVFDWLSYFKLLFSKSSLYSVKNLLTEFGAQLTSYHLFRGFLLYLKFNQNLSNLALKKWIITPVFSVNMDFNGYQIVPQTKKLLISSTAIEHIVSFGSKSYISIHRFSKEVGTLTCFHIVFNTGSFSIWLHREAYSCNRLTKISWRLIVPPMLVNSKSPFIKRRNYWSITLDQRLFKIITTSVNSLKYYRQLSLIKFIIPRNECISN